MSRGPNRNEHNKCGPTLSYTVGLAFLRHSLASPDITRLSILSRREFTPVGDGLDVNKAHVIVHEDYQTYPKELLKTLKGCVWAQDISQTGGKGVSALNLLLSVLQTDFYIYPLAATMYASLTIILSLLQKHFDPFLENSTSSMFRARGKLSISSSAKASDIPPVQCRSHRKDIHSFWQDKRSRRSGTSCPPIHPAYSALRVFNARPGYVDPPEHHRPRSLA